MSAYDPKDVKVVVDGTVLTGFAEGTFVQCQKNTETYSMNVGALGEVDFAKSADETGQITVTLKHTSPSNRFLTRLAKGRNSFPVQVIDRNTNGVNAGGTECRIQKLPDQERSNDITSLEWVFLVADYDVN